MSVVEVIAKATGLDPAKAEAAAGGLLAAIRMSARPEAFAPIEKAIPNAKELILKSGPGMSGGRTGEMIALVSELKSAAGVAKLTAQLGRAGITPDQVAGAAKALLGFVRQQEGDAALQPLLDASPALQDLAK